MTEWRRDIDNNEEIFPLGLTLYSLECDSDIPEERKMNLSNYDVLWTPGRSLHYDDNDSSRHVGNLRFRIDLDLNSKAYQEAHMASDSQECDIIVDRIIDTIKVKSEPKGRFLQVQQPAEASSAVPRELGPEESQKLVHQALRELINEEGDGMKVQRRASAYSLSTCTTEPTSDAVSSPKKVLVVESQEYPLPNPPPLDIDSTSGSVSPPLPDVILPRSSMDVVLSASRQSLLPYAFHVGNNRFRVLMEIQSQTFAKEPNLERQLTLVTEVYTIVTTHWSGQFLCVDSSSWTGMTEMSCEEAEESILEMLQNGTAVPLPTPSPVLDPISVDSAFPPPLTLDNATSMGFPAAFDRVASPSVVTSSLETIQGMSDGQLRRKSIEDLKVKNSRRTALKRLEEKQASRPSTLLPSPTKGKTNRRRRATGSKVAKHKYKLQQPSKRVSPDLMCSKESPILTGSACKKSNSRFERKLKRGERLVQVQAQ